jgi:hypothetical protein
LRAFVSSWSMLSERSGLRARSEFIDRREIEKRKGSRRVQRRPPSLMRCGLPGPGFVPRS